MESVGIMKDKANKKSEKEQETVDTEIPVETQPEVDLGEIIKNLENENADLRDKYLRAMAEFENFRKRQERILVEMIEQERNNVIGRLIDIADDVARATSAALESKCDPQIILDGINLISRRINELLKLEGIVSEDPTGKKFDPLEQEALGAMDVDSPELDGCVLQTLQPVYKRGGRLIRPARVFVGKLIQNENE